jgi:hypothetical protein
MKKTLILTTVVICTAAICLGIYANQGTPKITNVLLQKEVARAACEITNGGGTVIFKCKGEEGTCSTKKFGYTLTCSGTEVVTQAEIEEE